jgi:hypothetical protein
MMPEQVKRQVVRRARRASDPLNNRLDPLDRAAHDWFRFVLSFPPHLVRQYTERFGLGKKSRVLDPFCGTGTTLVECKKHGIASVGVEANPMAHFASRVKVDWSPDADGLVGHATHIAQDTLRILRRQGIDDMGPVFSDAASKSELVALRGLPDEAQALLLTDSISPLQLHKVLVLLEQIDRNRDDCYYDHERLAVAKAAVFSFSNLHFGPEVGVGPAKQDVPVVAPWLDAVKSVGEDLRALGACPAAPTDVFHADARAIAEVVKPRSIDAVITSPPYPNEKDYTRTTRLESVLLGFIRSKAELRALKAGMVRSNTRGVYKGDNDDRWITAHPDIQRIAVQIEIRRLELGKTSGFERLYARVTKLYFGGMARHLADLRTVLRPGARLSYVVGDQASYLRVMIRTGQLLADIARSLGYTVESIDLFRTRLSTATREQLREEVVVLRWPG